MKIKIVGLISLIITLIFVGAVYSGVVFRDDFYEDFSLWDKHGSPLPVLKNSFEGRTGIFDNNGDGWCDSLVV